MLKSLLLSSILAGFLSCSHKTQDVKVMSTEPQPPESLKIPEKKGLGIESSEKFVPVKNRPQTAPVKKYCHELDKKFKRYLWGQSHCTHFKWHHVRNSNLGRPLIWKVYGDEWAHRKKPKSSTLVMCGVHGDEITPIKFCFDILKHLEVNRDQYKGSLIVVAPVVNPDSFLKRRPTRTNYNGVDINRNFPTKDWNQKALKLWRARYGSDKRRFPGLRPLSEPETLFQVNLIKRYKPDKIISVHAPLTLLDYDGPGDSFLDSSKERQNLPNQLLITMSQKAEGYKIKNYPFFPGSLGNWAGNERNIPTYTLELPTSDSRRSKDYWKLFREAIHWAFLHDFRPFKTVQK